MKPEPLNELEFYRMKQLGAMYEKTIEERKEFNNLFLRFKKTYY